MKVLILSHLFPRPKEITYGIFVLHQVKELIRLGCEIYVVSPVPYSPFPINQLSKKWLRYSQIPTHAKIDGINVRATRKFIK